MYLFWKRTSPPPVMVTFDAPLRDTCIVRRSDDRYAAAGAHDAERDGVSGGGRTLAAARSAVARTRTRSGFARLFELTLARPPQADEDKILLTALARYRQEYVPTLKPPRS